MTKGKKVNLTQAQIIVIASIGAILLEILITKIMLLADPSLDARKNASDINKVFFAFVVAGSVLLVWKTPVTIRWDSLRIGDRKRFGHEMLEAAVVSLVLIAVMFGVRLIMNRMDPDVAERPYFGLYLDRHGRWFYPISAVLQELFIKGLIQENYRSLSDGRNTHYTVAAVGLFFAVLHMNYPLYYLLGAGLLCFGTGYLYERDRNIWGSALIHFVIGFMPRALGLKI